MQIIKLLRHHSLSQAMFVPFHYFIVVYYYCTIEGLAYHPELDARYNYLFIVLDSDSQVLVTLIYRVMMVYNIQ